jgi:hypothetical protein
MKPARHVATLLAAFLDGELTSDERIRVEAHIEQCQRCATALHRIRQAREAATDLPLVEAPASLWARIESEIEAWPAARRTGLRWPRFATGAAGIGFAAVILVLAANRGGPKLGPSLEIASVVGAPTVGSKRLTAKSRLVQGEWLETDANSRAIVRVAQIGTVEVLPHSRLRLLGTSPREHRMELRIGRLSAKIEAPPRLFLVETPSSTAIDLGCEYTLQVDIEGRTELHVTFGEVALTRRDGSEVVVPAGMKCVTTKAEGPGTPFVEDAHWILRQALEAIDRGAPSGDDFKAVLERATQRNALTLYYLLTRERALVGFREAVFDRLAKISSPPEGVTKEGILRFDAAMLSKWHAEVKLVWWE